MIFPGAYSIATAARMQLMTLSKTLHSAGKNRSDILPHLNQCKQSEYASVVAMVSCFCGFPHRFSLIC
jgi:hypothetical protein